MISDAPENSVYDFFDFLQFGIFGSENCNEIISEKARLCFALY